MFGVDCVDSVDILCCRYIVKGFIRKVQSQIVRAVRLYVIPVFCTHRKE